MQHATCLPASQPDSPPSSCCCWSLTKDHKVYPRDAQCVPSPVWMTIGCAAVFQAARWQASPLPPAAQPQYQHASTEQAERPSHTKFGMEALEDMIQMGRALSNAPAPASQPHAHAPAAYAGAAHQHPSAQQSVHAAAVSHASHGRISVTESKKIKLDSNGLVALETSTTLTAQQPAAAPRQHQEPGLTSFPPGLRRPGSGTLFSGPSRHNLAGLRLQVEDDRAQVTTSMLTSSASATATPSPQYQGSTGRAPLRGFPMLTNDSLGRAPHSSNPHQTPHSATRRFSSGRGQVSLQACTLASFAL